LIVFLKTFKEASMKGSKNICGDRIREARIGRVKQQIEVAVELNLARTTYADIENGNRPIYDKDLKLISQYLDIDVRWFLDMNGAEEPIFPEENKRKKRVR